MPRVAKRSADKISEIDKDELKRQEAEKTLQALQALKEEAEEKRKNVLSEYLKENQGKPIKVTKPPPKKDKVTAYVAKPASTVPKKSPKSDKPPPAKIAKQSSSSSSGSSSSSSSSSKSSSSGNLPKKLATFDENQIISFLQVEGISAATINAFTKEKVNGKVLKGLWMHRNDEGMKVRIADIFRKLIPNDRDYALIINMLSSSSLRV